MDGLLTTTLPSESTVMKDVQATMRNPPKTSCLLPAVESVNIAMIINQIADGNPRNETLIKKDNEGTKIKTHRYDLRKMIKRTEKSANEQSNNQINIDVKVKQPHMTDQSSHNGRNVKEKPTIKRNDNITGMEYLMNTMTDDVCGKSEKKSTIYDHIKETRHTIAWENARIIWTDSIPRKLLIKESLTIKSYQPDLNKTMHSAPLHIYPNGIETKLLPRFK